MTDRDRLAKIIRNARMNANQLSQVGYAEADALLANGVTKVVRCKDCKYWDCYGGEDSHKGDCAELVGLESCMYEDDFCSYGELKELGK